jgi:zinc/manganese transport system substrate-binding protein
MTTWCKAVLSVGLTALLAVASAQAEDRISVVAAFSVLGDFVKNVGGDRVEVTTLVGPNNDVHVYSPTPGDTKRIAPARAVFMNGLGLEGWIARLVTASGSKAPVVIASTGVKTRNAVDGGSTGIDPHAWQSVANAKRYVANIRDSLDAVDPAGKATYDANAAVYISKLDALEEEVRSAVEKIPADRRKIITTHDAFGYFGDAYGMTFIAPEGVSTDAEPSAKVIAEIIGQIRRQKIPAVFMENITDPRLIREIARETAAKIGGTLYSDALSGLSGPAGSYIDMMRHNVREFSKALMVQNK